MSKNPWLAIDTATVPLVRARELKQAWEEFVTGGQPIDVREPIALSWERSTAAGVDPGAGRIAPVVSEPEEASDRWSSHPLASAADLIRDCLGPIADADGQLIVVSDADGVLLSLEGPEDVRLDAAEAMNFTEGAGWGEADTGTNAVGTALAADHAVQVFAAEHFNEIVQNWTCAAAPVHDPDTGGLLGVIDLTGRVQTAHPHSLACAVATVQAVQLHLATLMHERDAHLRARYERSVAGHPRRALLTPSGRVIAGDASWVGAPRLLVPPTAGELVLPSGAHAFVEPLGHDEAFVVRPSGRAARRGPRRPMIDLILLGRHRAEIRIDGREVRVGARHAEILALLSSRPDGMSAEELAADVYGDEGHPGTVRVQVHRLRKLLGEGIATEPYRLAMDVRSDWSRVQSLLDRGQVREGVEQYDGPLLPRSGAPGIEREREALDGWLRQSVMTSDDPDALWVWVQSSSGREDLLAWRRLLGWLPYADPRRSLAAAQVRALRMSFA